MIAKWIREHCFKDEECAKTTVLAVIGSGGFLALIGMLVLFIVR